MADYTNQSSTNPSTASQPNRMVTTMYNDRDSAEQGYSTLRERGYSDSDINLLMSDETRDKHFVQRHDDDTDTDLGNKAMEKAGVGSAIGGTIGAVAAAIAAIGTNLILPGLGLVVAGPLAAGLAGAGAGGLTGGLIGALVGSGIPDDRAKEYEEGIKQGGIVMGVSPRDEEDARHLEQHGFR
ncbi:hypothetical protein HNV11_12625 [Spirosoma taeanense]|uniref:General stress protein n=1 Tax=Spirosoma taeanense TaxID=2735870 RepID=A0A6M5YA50_9BACT|nr:hypothetical protein [Spirosoma taeanense]QJW90160.1 hypothetical protein HNV11_12625 [Spirosoma taeanense]